MSYSDLPFADKPLFLQNAYRTHVGGFRAVRDAAFVSVDITLDILNGCEHKCPGCFVQRKNDFIDDELLKIEDLINEMGESGYDLNEMFIGPTDIFSALNYERLITSEVFKRISKHFTLTCTTTLLNDTDVIAKKLQLFREELPQRERETEIFVILDLQRYVNRDWFYLNQLHRNIKLLHDWNVFFIVNVYSEEMFDDLNLTEITTQLKNDFGTKLRINPSYFRGTNKKHVELYANRHKRLLEKQINAENISDVFLNMTDLYFNSYTLLTYCFSNGSLSVMPFLYEAIPQHNELFEISRIGSKYQLSDLESKHDMLAIQQYQYACKTDECDSCEHLASCVSRDVLAYMETREITTCFLPKTMFRDASRAIELIELRSNKETTHD